MLITQAIDSLLNGVSQQPPSQRDPSQLTEQINGLSDLARGMRKRPPTEHVAKLTSDTTGYDEAFLHDVVRSRTEKYSVVVVDGDLKVYDKITGAEQSVIFPNGKAYLVGTAFRAVTVGDTTYIVNQDTVVGKLSSSSAGLVHEAYLVVKTAEIATTFTVTINGTVVAHTVTDGDGDTNTDTVAQVLKDALSGNSSLLASGFVITRFGSTLHVTRIDGADFTLLVTDGLGSAALTAIKGQVQSFIDLPQFAKNGSVLEIVGAPETGFDNYFVQYSESPTLGQAGVWKEVIKPGALTALDDATMPWQLVRGGHILPPIATVGPPPAPIVAAGAGTSTNYGWQKDETATIVRGEDTDWTLLAQGSGLRTAPTGLDGTKRTITVRYSFSSRSTFSSNFASAVLLTNTGPATAFVERARRDFYDGGGGYDNLTLTYTGNIPAGAEVELQLQYSAGAAVGAGVVPSAPAVLSTFSRANVAGAGLTVQSNTGTAITFDAAQKYAAACTVTVTLDGNPFAHTVGSVDETGAQVATALQLLIDASASYIATNPSAGLIIATDNSGNPPATALAAVTFNPVTTFFDPDLALVPNTLVGYTIVNQTDGGSGVIVSNTATTISVAIQTGGADNAFEKDDVCVVIGSGVYFAFLPVPWKTREAGDDTTCPFPSIVGTALDDVCFYQDRLGLIAGENIVLSATGDATRFFRATATQLLADDPIDVKASSGKATRFKNAVPWIDGLYLFTDHSAHRLSGTPALTPSTVRIDPMGDFACSPRVRPVTTASSLILPSLKSSATRLLEAQVQTTNSGEDALAAVDLTKHCPTYIAGDVQAIACDPLAEIIGVVTDGGAQRSLYVIIYHDEGGRRAQLSVSRWDFAMGSKLLAISILDGDVSLIFKRVDGAYLETLSLVPDAPQHLLTLDGTATLDGTYNLDGLIA